MSDIMYAGMGVIAVLMMFGYIAILLSIAYLIYTYATKIKSEKFNNSRNVSATDSLRVRYPMQWKDAHSGSADMHPVEF